MTVRIRVTVEDLEIGSEVTIAIPEIERHYTVLLPEDRLIDFTVPDNHLSGAKVISVTLWADNDLGYASITQTKQLVIPDEPTGPPVDPGSDGHTPGSWTVFAGTPALSYPVPPSGLPNFAAVGGLDDGAKLLLNESATQVQVAVIEYGPWVILHKIRNTNGVARYIAIANDVNTYTSQNGGFAHLQIDVTEFKYIAVDLQRALTEQTGEVIAKIEEILVRGSLQINYPVYGNGFALTPLFGTVVGGGGSGNYPAAYNADRSHIPPVRGDTGGWSVPNIGNTSTQSDVTFRHLAAEEAVYSKQQPTDASSSYVRSKNGKVYGIGGGYLAQIGTGGPNRWSWDVAGQAYYISGTELREWDYPDSNPANDTVLYDFATQGASGNLDFGPNEGNQSLDDDLFVVTQGDPATVVYAWSKSRGYLGKRTVAQVRAIANSLAGRSDAPSDIDWSSASLMGRIVVALRSWGYVVYDDGDFSSPSVIGRQDQGTFKKLRAQHSCLMTIEAGEDAIAVAHGFTTGSPDAGIMIASLEDTKEVWFTPHGDNFGHLAHPVHVSGVIYFTDNRNDRRTHAFRFRKSDYDNTLSRTDIDLIGLHHRPTGSVEGVRTLARTQQAGTNSSPYPPATTAVSNDGRYASLNHPGGRGGDAKIMLLEYTGDGGLGPGQIPGPAPAETPVITVVRSGPNVYVECAKTEAGTTVFFSFYKPGAVLAHTQSRVLKASLVAAYGLEDADDPETFTQWRATVTNEGGLTGDTGLLPFTAPDAPTGGGGTGGGGTVGGGGGGSATQWGLDKNHSAYRAFASECGQRNHRPPTVNGTVRSAGNISQFNSAMSASRSGDGIRLSGTMSSGLFTLSKAGVTVLAQDARLRGNAGVRFTAADTVFYGADIDASSNNSNGIVRLEPSAPRAKLLGCKVRSRSGGGYTAIYIRGDDQEIADNDVYNAPKDSKGIECEDRANRTHIHHNTMRDSLSTSGRGQPCRIGTYARPMGVLFEYNLIDNWNDDDETIELKGSNCRIFNNLILNTGSGHLSNRFGSDNIWYGNLFDKAKTGIRFNGVNCGGFFNYSRNSAGNDRIAVAWKVKANGGAIGYFNPADRFNGKGEEPGGVICTVACNAFVDYPNWAGLDQLTRGDYSQRQGVEQNLIEKNLYMGTSGVGTNSGWKNTKNQQTAAHYNARNTTRNNWELSKSGSVYTASSAIPELEYTFKGVTYRPPSWWEALKRN